MRNKAKQDNFSLLSTHESWAHARRATEGGVEEAGASSGTRTGADAGPGVPVEGRAVLRLDLTGSSPLSVYFRLQKGP